jgi:hypothetical protein
MTHLLSAPTQSNHPTDSSLSGSHLWQQQKQRHEQHQLKRLSARSGQTCTRHSSLLRFARRCDQGPPTHFTAERKNRGEQHRSANQLCDATNMHLCTGMGDGWPIARFVCLSVLVRAACFVCACVCVVKVRVIESCAEPTDSRSLLRLFEQCHQLDLGVIWECRDKVDAILLVENVGQPEILCSFPFGVHVARTCSCGLSVSHTHWHAQQILLSPSLKKERLTSTHRHCTSAWGTGWKLEKSTEVATKVLNGCTSNTLSPSLPLPHTRSPEHVLSQSQFFSFLILTVSSCNLGTPPTDARSF